MRFQKSHYGKDLNYPDTHLRPNKITIKNNIRIYLFVSEITVMNLKMHWELPTCRKTKLKSLHYISRLLQSIVICSVVVIHRQANLWNRVPNICFIYICIYIYIYSHVICERRHESESQSVVSDSFATPLSVARQPPLSMEFFRQEYWNVQLFPSPGNLPNPGIEPRSPALQADFFTS